VIAELLKQASRPQHTAAENSDFITQLMRGQLNLQAYTKYLTNLAWLYEALEEQTAHGAALEGSASIYDERLNRLDSITADLEALGVNDWKATTKPSSAMVSYIEHIRSLEGKSDLRLVAHHYTRYLGDLSGGQAIAALVGRHYGATPDQLSFYNFAEIEDNVRFKEAYRDNLDGLTLNDEELNLLVQEVQLAFEFNQKVFEDLAR
jgi:heme oxygenase